MNNEVEQQEHLEWLLHTPFSDGNFIHHLKKADVDTLKEALKDDEITKSARKKIEIEIRKRENGK